VVFHKKDVGKEIIKDTGMPIWGCSMGPHGQHGTPSQHGTVRKTWLAWEGKPGENLGKPGHPHFREKTWRKPGHPHFREKTWTPTKTWTPHFIVFVIVQSQFKFSIQFSISMSPFLDKYDWKLQ
jgi:hypothetical protein